MRILVRVLALVATVEASVALMSLGYDANGGADIGAGLVAFALLGGAGFAGGLLDGRREPLATVVLRWVVVGVVVGVAETLAIPLRDGSFDVATLVSDLRVVAPMLTALVVVGAVTGAAVGGSLSASSSAPRS